MLHKNILDKKSYDLLRSIMQNDKFSKFHLVGGTALSLMYGHRLSIDLDLFSPQEFKTNILDDLGYKYQPISVHDNSIEIICEDTKTFFFKFNYPLSTKLVIENDIRLAGPIDIGLMKLLALEGRSTKKDIVDLFIIDSKVMPLEELFILFEKTYSENFNSYSSLKTLINIDDLIESPDPHMLIDLTFEHAFEVVSEKIKSIIKSKIAE